MRFSARKEENNDEEVSRKRIEMGGRRKEKWIHWWPIEARANVRFSRCLLGGWEWVKLVADVEMRSSVLTQMYRSYHFFCFALNFFWNSAKIISSSPKKCLQLCHKFTLNRQWVLPMISIIIYLKQRPFLKLKQFRSFKTSRSQAVNFYMWCAILLQKLPTHLRQHLFHINFPTRNSRRRWIDRGTIVSYSALERSLTLLGLACLGKWGVSEIMLSANFSVWLQYLNNTLHVFLTVLQNKICCLPLDAFVVRLFLSPVPKHGSSGISDLQLFDDFCCAFSHVETDEVNLQSELWLFPNYKCFSALTTTLWQLNWPRSSTPARKCRSTMILFAFSTTWFSPIRICKTSLVYHNLLSQRFLSSLTLRLIIAHTYTPTKRSIAQMKHQIITGHPPCDWISSVTAKRKIQKVIQIAMRRE